MKLVAISDIHGFLLEDLPAGDLLTISGDVCPVDDSHHPVHQRHWIDRKFLPYLDKMIQSGQYKDIVFIAGNHDFGLEKYNYTGLFKSATYLNNSGATYKKINFWGSPISPNFNGWAFGKERGDELMAHWKKIPDNTNVLITHGPPYGVLDRLARSQIDVGDYDLLERIKQLKKLKLHVFGHIHEGYGTEDKLGFNCVNASFLNENYICGHNPTIVVDI